MDELDNVPANVVAAIVPYLLSIGGKMADKISEQAVEAGGKLFSWLTDRLTGRAKEALQDLQQKPDDIDNQADLRKQLSRAKEADPNLFDEIRNQLGTLGLQGSSMEQIINGNKSKAIQIQGSGNQSSIT